MNCKEAIPMIHEYLDGDLEEPMQRGLYEHLQACGVCSLHLKQLERTDALLRSAPRMKPSADITERIMNAIPRSRARIPLVSWVRRHPAISVAAVFVAVMLGSFISLWNQDSNLVVKGSDLEQVVIKGDTVLVPAGHVVQGDLFVQNGEIEVDGKVNGDVVVIDGRLNMASTAVVAGQVTHIDKALDWLWYKMNHWAVSIVH